MTPPLLAPGAHLLLEGSGQREEAHLVTVTAHGLQIRRANHVSTSGSPDPEETVAWTALQRVSVRRDRRRAWGVPFALGVLGALGFGSCGVVLDAVGRSTQGTLAPGDTLTTTTATIGFLLGALVGCVVIFSRSRFRWETIYEAPTEAAYSAAEGSTGPDGAPLALDERLERGAREVARNAARHRSRRMRETVLAWAIFAAFVLGLFLWMTAAARQSFVP